MNITKIINDLDFISIRVQEDNLMYLFFDETSAFSFDASSPKAILHALSCDFQKQNYTEDEIYQLKPSKNRKLLYSFTTHSHFDHNGGDAELKKLYPTINMVNFSNYKNFDNFNISKFEVIPIETPCHTLDSLCYLVKNTLTNKSYTVTGDFIFKLGCGKFFEGNAAMFIDSLNKLISKLDKSTLLLYGHDYYIANRKFTEQFYSINDCENFFLTLEEEQKYNPFFKAMNSEIIEGEKEERIDKLRKLKNNFKFQN